MKAVAIAACVLLVSPLTVAAPAQGDEPEGLRTDRSSAMHAIIVTYWPPEYIGGDSTVAEDPETLQGIEGGMIHIAGRGDLESVAARLDDDTLYADPYITGWAISLTMPSKPGEIFISDGMEDKVVALKPIKDSLPGINLLEPAGDTTVTAHAKVRLVAQVTDDHGLADAYFEIVQPRTARLGKAPAQPIRKPGQRLQVVLSLDSLKVGPGDVLQWRAVAKDLGPSERGQGVSEARTIKVAP